MSAPDDIMLGEGVFSIGMTPVALTRGGGQFTVERDYRIINADGDYGPVRGRIRKNTSVARLTLNALELVPANVATMYPAMEVTNDAGPPVTDTLKAKEQIDDTDYQDTVTWTGKTVGGRGVVITLQNAINLGNLDWSLVDKEEVVPQVVYTATYDETDRKTEPWQVQWADPA